jgi:hypothetical protein
LSPSVRTGRSPSLQNALIEADLEQREVVLELGAAAEVVGAAHDGVEGGALVVENGTDGTDETWGTKLFALAGPIVLYGFL